MINVYIIAVIITATALVMLGSLATERIRAHRRSLHLASQRMQLLRRLLNLAYVYGYNPELFMNKFREEVNISHLHYCDVICNYDDQKQLTLMAARKDPLKNQDALLFILLNKGFTPQELSVIYGMASCNSIYVRCSRIRKRYRMVKTEEPHTQTPQSHEIQRIATKSQC